MADPRDVDAAHALVELANGLSHLPNNNLPSFRGNHGMVRTLDGELLMTMLRDDKRQHADRFRGGGKMKASGERLHFPLLKANNMERRQRKRKTEDDFSLSYLKKYRNGNISEEEEQEEKEKPHEVIGLLDARLLTSSWGKKCRRYIEARVSDDDRFGMGYLESKMETKSRKAKADKTYLYGSDAYDLCARSQNLTDVPISLKNIHGLQKAYAGTGSLRSGKVYDPVFSEKMALDDVVPVRKSANKQRLTLITSTLNNGASFSIIHLLSAVRTALITPYSEDQALVFDKILEKGNRRQVQCNDTQNGNPEGIMGFHSHERDVINAEQIEQKNLPSLTIHEIVQRVRSKPGDPCILETKEPLPDLVRGVLNIFSSRTAPLGVKGWKVLTVYEKTGKCWSWIGPISFNVSRDDYIEEDFSEAWGIPHRTLVKLVNFFANWLKQGQEMLQQIGSLPAPPVILMQPTNRNEKLKDMRAMKSLSTISPSCEEVRDYFRREEALRYLIPDRAFSYTALDGRKSTVAPLRRCSGKPSAKARDHFMLKHKRPPHFTVLCLVRDAAARLPGSIGTRADVCTLVRDSLFITEDITDLQVNQVVSGALDRLHYEFDPCVRFDKDRHLWIYLHGEREDEDFEHDGSSSRKKGRQLGEMQEVNLA